MLSTRGKAVVAAYLEEAETGQLTAHNGGHM